MSPPAIPENHTMNEPKFPLGQVVTTPPPWRRSIPRTCGNAWSGTPPLIGATCAPTIATRTKSPSAASCGSSRSIATGRGSDSGSSPRLTGLRPASNCPRITDPAAAGNPRGFPAFWCPEASATSAADREREIRERFVLLRQNSQAESVAGTVRPGHGHEICHR